MSNPLNREVKITGPHPEIIIDEGSRALIDLVARGYGFEGKEDYLISQAEMEYASPDTRTYFAHVNGEPVGSLALADFSQENESSQAEIFWQHLSPQLQARINQCSPDVINIHGIVTAPEARHQGIARHLLTQAIIDIKPSVILSNTKTPELAALLATFTDEGYRIFLGHHEISANSPGGRTAKHLPILQAYWATREEVNPLEGIHFHSTDVLPPYVPDTRKVPESVRHAFQPIVAAQKRVGEQKTAVGALLAIHNSILR
jgi:hypothetical protein